MTYYILILWHVTIGVAFSIIAVILADHERLLSTKQTESLRWLFLCLFKFIDLLLFRHYWLLSNSHPSKLMCMCVEHRCLLD